MQLQQTIVPGREQNDLGEVALTRLLGGETSHVTRFSTPSLSVAVQNDASATFRLDGEMIDGCEVTVETKTAVLSMRVGDGYDPHPVDAAPN